MRLDYVWSFRCTVSMLAGVLVIMAGCGAPPEKNSGSSGAGHAATPSTSAATPGPAAVTPGSSTEKPVDTAKPPETVPPGPRDPDDILIPTPPVAPKGPTVLRPAAPDLPADEPAKTAPKVEPKADPKPEPKIEPKPEPKAAPKVEPKADPKPEPKAEPKPEPKAEPKPEPKPEPKAEPKTEPAKKDPAKTDKDSDLTPTAPKKS